MSILAGKNGEKYVAKNMKKMGYKIIEMNYRTRFGEIDIIAGTRDYIVFVEVKTRNEADNIVKPFEAIDRVKLSKIERTARMYLSVSKDKRQPRFDAAAVYTRNGIPVRMEYLENILM